VSWSNSGLAQLSSRLPADTATQIPTKNAIAEASDGDGEVPDEIEAPEAASPQPASDISSPEVQSTLSNAHPAEASDGDGELPDAVENR
jgi:hypothetical protein